MCLADVMRLPHPALPESQLAQLSQKIEKLHYRKRPYGNHTTILAGGALAWLSGEVNKGLSLALLFGVTVGTYASIYIAAPVLLYFRVCSELKESEQPFERQA